MSLTRTDTGQAATPLEQMQEMNERKRLETENALLKEALMISNEKCNALIDRQNALITDLTSTVEQVRRDNLENRVEIKRSMNTAVQEIRQITQEERQFKAEISSLTEKAIRISLNEILDCTKNGIEIATAVMKKQIDESAKEIEKQRNELKEQGLFRKIFFWATPILLVAQTIAIIISMI